MAISPTFQENFESGTKGNFDGTTSGTVTFPHWKTLAATAGRPMPYRGAYVAQIDLADDNSYLLENTGFDLTTQTTYHLRFYFYLSTDLVMAASDRFTMFDLRSASASEVVLDIHNNAGEIRLIGAETAAGSNITYPISLGRWYAVEASMTVDTDAGGDGTLDVYVDGNQAGSQLTTITQANITNARFGVQAIDAGTTTGRLYLDAIVLDDSRVFPFAERKPFVVEVTDDEHVFVGPGVVKGATLRSRGAANTAFIYDTDTADINDVASRKIELDLDTHTTWEGEMHFEKGCYVNVTGTNPRVEITIDRDQRGHKPYVYQSDAALCG